MYNSNPIGAMICCMLHTPPSMLIHFTKMYYLFIMGWHFIGTKTEHHVTLTGCSRKIDRFFK